MSLPARYALRARILSCLGGAKDDRFLDLEDGLITIEGDRIVEVRRAGSEAAEESATPVIHLPGRIAIPGLIDAHIHYPQLQVIASHASDLLEWLSRHTFPAETRFADPAHAAREAAFFVSELLRNGTTAAAVYCTVHAASVNALCAEAAARRMRVLTGKVMMDRNAPPDLRDDAESGYRESRSLIRRWHGRERISYTVTPRFAITSSEAQLEAAGRLLAEHPDIYLQTHLSEQPGEIAEVRRLFPWSSSYTEVYERFGLLGPRSLFGHCIHLGEAECAELSRSGSVAVLCPTSNSFLGSGIVDLERLSRRDRPVRLALGSDVGGGTSISMLQTMAELYRLQRLAGRTVSPVTLFRLATLGNAEALSLQEEIGSLEAGKMADLVVLDPARKPILRHRIEAIRGDRTSETLFALAILGDEQIVEATFVAGRPLYVAPDSGVRLPQKHGQAQPPASGEG